jgi:hypothetical protein
MTAAATRPVQPHARLPAVRVAGAATAGAITTTTTRITTTTGWRMRLGVSD